MSDLDDFFAKRLDEEASFPNRGKNWKQMSKRLDAFDAGAVQGLRPNLRLWQAATVVAVAVAGFLLWKTHSIQQENRDLRKDVAGLQTERSQLAGQLAMMEQADRHYPIAGPNKKINPNNTNQTEPPIFSNQTIVADKVNSTLNSTAPVAKEKPGPAPEKMAANPPQADDGPKGETGIALEPPVAPKQDIPVQIAPQTLDSASVVAIENVHTIQPKDSLESGAQVAALVAEIKQLKDSLALNQPIAQEIKPVRASKTNFRIGAQATLGFVQPKQEGISAIRGQGITFEANVFKSIWLSASVDWLHHDVCTKDFVKKFHPHHDSLPNPPGGGWGGGGGGGGPQHQHKLILVESTPRQQQFGLGVRYELPIQMWVRPSIRLAHEWVRFSPTLVTYKFEEDDPGPGGPGGPPRTEYTAEQFDAQWLSNQWRFGIGLEKDIPNWTFGLWADYSKDFAAADPSFDALYLRAGAQYRF